MRNGTVYLESLRYRRDFLDRAMTPARPGNANARGCAAEARAPLSLQLAVSGGPVAVARHGHV